MDKLSVVRYDYASGQHQRVVYHKRDRILGLRSRWMGVERKPVYLCNLGTLILRFRKAISHALA